MQVRPYIPSLTPDTPVPFKHTLMNNITREEILKAQKNSQKKKKNPQTPGSLA